MQKKLFSLLLIALATGSLRAQLVNSGWKGVLKLNDPINVTFNFGRDTLTVINLGDNSLIETMTYVVKDSALTIKKVSGQSDCEASTIGRYKYFVKDGLMVLRAVEDLCDDRKPYLDNLQLTKN